MNSKPTVISKVLSGNDLGETGSHQAGMVISKKSEVLQFFPDLGCEIKNPRVSLYFIDDFGKEWKLNFIYYNNKFFDVNGTRNEYRLTGMTAYFHENGLKVGDTIILRHLENGTDTISYKRAVSAKIQKSEENGQCRTRIVINTGWKVIDY